MSKIKFDKSHLYNLGCELQNKYKRHEIALGVFNMLIKSFPDTKEAIDAASQIEKILLSNPHAEPNYTEANYIFDSGEIPDKLTYIRIIPNTTCTFCNPNEQAITTIGTGYIANYISGGGAERSGATLTTKRIYFTGEIFSLDGKGGLLAIKQQKIVNVRDVTGAGYTLYRPLSMIVYGIIALIISFMIFFGIDGTDVFGNLINYTAVGGIIIGIGNIIGYFMRCKTLLVVEYAGGNISFDVRWLQKNEQDNFIRNIHLTKDKIYSTAAADQGFTDNA